MLAKQGRPGWIGSIARGRYLALISAGQVDRIQFRASATAISTGGRTAEIHQHATVRRPGRALDEKTGGQEPLALPIWLHDADRETAALDLGEGDEVAARRPHRRRILARAEADALRPAAAGGHHVKLLRDAAVGVEDDL